MIRNGNAEKELERQRQGSGIIPGKRNKSEGPKVKAFNVFNKPL